MAVDAVTSVVLQKLSSLDVDESFTSKRIKGRLEQMAKDLKNARISLDEAAARETNDEEIKKLTGEYIGYLYSTEDSIEKFALGFTRRKKRSGFLINHALFFNRFTALNVLGYKLHIIQTMVNDLDSRTSSLQGSRGTATSADDDGTGEAEVMESTPFLPTDEGIDGRRSCMKRSSSVPTTPTSSFKVLKHSKTSMVRERMEHSKLMYSYSYNEEELSIVGHQHKAGQLRDSLGIKDVWIIPLVGEMGLGKTMLARAVYGDRTINRKFQVAAWVSISEESKTADILLGLLNQVKTFKAQDGGSSDEQDLKSKLTQELKDKSYLIVLDGLQYSGQWISLEEAFPRHHGSKIILTTSDEQVVEHDDSKWQPYYLEKLDREESWTLFIRKVAFREDPEDLDLKKKIVEGCQGLPLNIVLLGSLLSTKDRENWHETFDKLKTHKKWQVSDILKLCYDDLDYCLKLCLIYMTLFPKELDIPVRRLKRLWIAEGFVKQEEGEFQEDVAQKHFEDLVKRSLIMVSKQRSDGSPRKCRLLGALHSLLATEALDISLFHVHVKPEPDCQRVGSFSHRRLIEHACAEPCPLEPSQSTLLRSYISFNYQKKDTPAKYVSSLVSKMVGKGLGLLRVLDLEGVYRPSLPENLGDLIHLRYLGLRWTFLDKLPKSVGELPYLETLDLKHTCIDKIPTSIWKLRKLRHLNLDQVHLDKDTLLHLSSSLPDLLSLWGLTVSHESPITNGLSKLKHLRELGISFRLIKHSEDAAQVGSTPPAQSAITLVEWISKLKHLRQLRLRSIDDTGSAADLTLKPFSQLRNLSHMKLLGKLQQLPRIDEFPPQIKVLTLSLSYLNEDPMPILGNLQSLTVLRLLGNAFVGDIMICKRNTFKKLAVLKLWVLEDLKKFEVEDGAMKTLKEVNIRRCCKLENFPSRLLQQKTFEELILNDMPPAFKENIQMEYQSKVSIKDFGSFES